MLDQKKTGKFIAELRKELGLTQKELAEQLGVTDKAISKWECGRSMPDNSILMDLCQILMVNVNELLSGERLSSDSYSGKAEENMMNLMKVTEEEKANSRITFFGTICGFAALLATLFLMMVGAVQGGIYRFIDLPSLLGIIGITTLVLAVSGMLRDFFCGFSICYGKTADISADKVMRAACAFREAIVTLPVAGGFMFIVNIEGIMSVLAEPAQLGPMITVALVSLVYSFLMVLILLPTAVKLSVKFHKMTGK